MLQTGQVRVVRHLVKRILENAYAEAVTPAAVKEVAATIIRNANFSSKIVIESIEQVIQYYFPESTVTQRTARSVYDYVFKAD